MVGENGIKLSGGQRQRLAIARSIIKRPPILILDEATSAIDVRGEQIVQKALDRVSKNRTTISIAHRLSTVKKADTIVVLKNGEVVELGSHEDLLTNKDGVYYNLVHAQQLNMDGPVSKYAEESLEPVYTQAISNGKVGDPGASNILVGEADRKYRAKGLFRTVGLFLLEQKHRWRLYGLTVVAAMGCGGKCFSFYSNYKLQSNSPHFAVGVTAWEIRFSSIG